MFIFFIYKDVYNLENEIKNNINSDSDNDSDNDLTKKSLVCCLCLEEDKIKYFYNYDNDRYIHNCTCTPHLHTNCFILCHTKVPVCLICKQYIRIIYTPREQFIYNILYYKYEYIKFLGVLLFVYILYGK